MDINKLPKVELHCHLDGSLPLAFVQDMLGDKSITKEQLEAPKDCDSLATYLERFALPGQCLQTKEGLKRAGYALLAEVAKENVRYIEIRFAPYFSRNESQNYTEVIESLLEGLEEGKRDFGVSYNVIVCAMRHLSEKENEEMLYKAVEFLGHGVCALDLAGDEAPYPTKLYRKLFQTAKNLNMPFIIHSGECGIVENVREAVCLGAKRIGHGIALMEDKTLMQEVASRGVGIEMCPTSNIQTKAIQDFGKYPLKLFLDNNLLVSVNTDNRTVSNTTMTKELELIYKSVGEDEEVIKKVIRNAIETSFASEEEKHSLLKLL